MSHKEDAEIAAERRDYETATVFALLAIVEAIEEVALEIRNLRQASSPTPGQGKW